MRSAVSYRSSPRQPSWRAPAALFALVFAGASYALTPDAPGKDMLRAERIKRTTDHHYPGCRAARADGHQNIASWEPSYRARMDGDHDGFACEPHL